MSGFAEGLDNKVELLREQLAEAREAGDEFREQALIEELSDTVNIAGENDLDTSELKKVLAAETGTIPVIDDPED
ncbi:hypothetical protein HMPREF3172_01390 [Brevibacterium sp. HMSC08F02]|uniref:Uncharacterized protein n=1 Tax=Brevibacterium ravenspurgense TaxID=479117 RepID=A0A150H784_9MICO|nr:MULTISPECIES: hypothetical protein [Brevibacterium]KXZ57966.1 hypothetical protein Bravens_00998 [Brevibacterium ravenspurgense]MCG7300802.1 hypothetical protein [Brevibacterium ravenspurgense]OFT27115.1 hypothetical protein HMPREF3172_01390 [Brevibacterium sp. HMSC08F02]OFT93119.1 hypothetical protein HMPREF3092_06160 [Brevibacterium sp. HMSC24B04]